MKTQPITLEDGLFGQLNWDEETQSWEGSVRAGPGESFALHVQPRSDADRSISDEARQIYAKLRADFAGIRRHAFQEFLSQTRNQPFYQALTLERLLTVMRADAILVRADGYLEVGFADPEGTVFGGGHLIVSRFWPTGTREVVLDG